MDHSRREFLEELLGTPSPSGFESRGQRVWVDYVSSFADDVRTDAYGNAVAAYNEGGSGPSVAFVGHADEIGFIVNYVDDDGFVYIDTIGGSDATVSRGQRVTIHATEGPVEGVIGQTPIHLRDHDEDEVDEVTKQYVDIGASDREAAEAVVEVGDPITFATPVTELRGTRVAARGMDNRVGTWAAAEGLRKAVEADVDATVYAVSTVQEELGLRGAKMVGFDLDPDAVLVVDVTFATDVPDGKPSEQGDVTLGGGPAVGRGSANHPKLVTEVREAAATAGIDVQLEALGSGTGTDADAIYTQRSGVPTMTVSVPNRYMHTPVEVVDTDDLTAIAELFAAFAERVSSEDAFSVDV